MIVTAMRSDSKEIKAGQHRVDLSIDGIVSPTRSNPLAVAIRVDIAWSMSVRRRKWERQVSVSELELLGNLQRVGVLTRRTAADQILHASSSSLDACRFRVLIRMHK
jgi:hypothetical protein